MNIFSYVDESGNFKVVKFIWHIFLLVAFISILGFGWKMVTRPARTAAEIAERVMDGDNVLQVYAGFYDRYEAMNATSRKINNHKRALKAFLAGAPKDREKWEYNQQEEYSRLSAAILGVENILEDQIGEYNSMASRLDTKIFKGRELPQKIDAEYVYEKGGF